MRVNVLQRQEETANEGVQSEIEENISVELH